MVASMLSKIARRNFPTKLFAPSNRLILFSVALCTINTLLLVLNSSSIKDRCDREWKSHFRTSVYGQPQNMVHRPPRSLNHKSKSKNHWQIDEDGEQFLVTVAGDFNWDEEFVRMMSVIPVLEYQRNKTDKDGREKMDVDENPFIGGSNFSEAWQQSINVSEVLYNVKRPTKTTFRNIFNEWEKLSNNPTRKNIADGSERMIGCKQMRELEQAKDYPYIRYTFRSLTFWKGTLYLSRTEKIDIKQNRYLKTKPLPGKDVNEVFEMGKDEMLNLIKVQGLYGIPPLYALCITTIKEKDVQEYYDNDQEDLLNEGYMIRYISGRFDETNSIPFCRTARFTDECMRLNQLSTFVRSRERPAVAAMQVMFNLARMFDDMWTNKVYIDELNADEIILAKDLNVYVTGLQTLRFLTKHQYSLHSNTSRLLDGTICVRANECPVPRWHASQIGFKIGMSCAECKGFCAMDNACWGVDTHTYACMFSRWFYTRLHDAIPPSWKMDHLLTKLITCGADMLPDTRCTWTDLRLGMEQFLKDAIENWPEKDV